MNTVTAIRVSERRLPRKNPSLTQIALLWLRSRHELKGGAKRVQRVYIYLMGFKGWKERKEAMSEEEKKKKEYNHICIVIDLNAFSTVQQEDLAPIPLNAVLGFTHQDAPETNIRNIHIGGSLCWNGPTTTAMVMYVSGLMACEPEITDFLILSRYPQFRLMPSLAYIITDRPVRIHVCKTLELLQQQIAASLL